MEVQSPAVKRHYDITMSRRTRKQQQQQQQSLKSDINNTTKDVAIVETSHILELKESFENNDHKSLKQLLIGEEKEANNNNHEGENKERNNSPSLGEHFSEEQKQLQLVRLQQKDNLQSLKFKKLVSRYAKVLGHLIKAKRDPHLCEASKKKSVSSYQSRKNLI